MKPVSDTTSRDYLPTVDVRPLEWVILEEFDYTEEHSRKTRAMRFSGIYINAVKQMNGLYLYKISTGNGLVLNKATNEFEYEPLPSNRDDDWIKNHRWEKFEEARDIAKMRAFDFLDYLRGRSDDNKTNL